MSLPDVNDLTRQDTADGIQQQVVGAAIIHNGQILLLQRPLNDFRGGTWELPSGKTEPGEDLTTALHREVLEETGLIDPGGKCVMLGGVANFGFAEVGANSVGQLLEPVEEGADRLFQLGAGFGGCAGGNGAFEVGIE